MKYFKALLFLLVFALVLQCMVYFGFDSAYFSHKDLKAMPEFYSQNIYKYRVLSTSLFESFFQWINPFLEQLRNQPHFEKSMRNLGSNFYLSLFIYNTFFLGLFTISLFHILRLSYFQRWKTIEKCALVIGVLVFISLSQYIKTPYDISSYFFLMIGVLLSLQYFLTSQSAYIFGLSGLILVSTFNRETSALNLSFLAATAVCFHSTKWLLNRKNCWIIIVPTLAYLVSYIGIRWWIGSTQVVQSNYIVQNILEFKNILGFLFFVLMYLFLEKINPQNQRYVRWILLFSMPYFMTILIGGILWEIRLYIPVLILFSIAQFTYKTSWHA